MLFVGLDLHKNYSEFAIMDNDGRLIKHGRVENSLEDMSRFSNSLPLSTPIAIESSSTWYWSYKLLSQRHMVSLSNPVKNKAIASAKVKTDKVDSIMLATLLRGGFLAESYVPPREIIDLRELVRHRANLVRERTRIKNLIHSYLLMNNIHIDAHPFTKEFMRELSKIEDVRIKSYLRLIDALNADIRDASDIIVQRAKDNQESRLLMTIPGISYYSALLIASEIGEIDRFKDSSSLVAYAGLAPSTYSSGGKTYHGAITKQGSRYLRWVLGQCTRAHIKADPDGTVAIFYTRLRKKKGDHRAIVAASAKLLKIVYWVLKERRGYHG
jgi:transposase